MSEHYYLIKSLSAGVVNIFCVTCQSAISENRSLGLNEIGHITAKHMAFIYNKENN